MDKLKITLLAENVFEAEERVNALSMMNVAGLDYEDKRKSSVDYAIAQTELIEARRALRLEQGE